jgi:hypothetical protein
LLHPVNHIPGIYTPWAGIEAFPAEPAPEHQVMYFRFLSPPYHQYHTAQAEITIGSCRASRSACSATHAPVNGRLIIPYVFQHAQVVQIHVDLPVRLQGISEFDHMK